MPADQNAMSPPAQSPPPEASASTLLRQVVVAIARALGAARRDEAAALTALVGRAVGAGDWRTARRTAWIGGLLALLVAECAGLATSWAPLAFVSMFTSDPEVAAIAALALAYIGPAFGFFGMGMAMYFAAMGAQRLLWPVVAGLARITLAVGAGAWLASQAGMGLAGHFLGVALGITAYGVLAAMGVRAAVWSASR